jgi:leader peptidase (prepilin peptidase)/N-methyltransferase
MSESQQLVLFLFSGVFGLTIGSFLNVCIFRLPRNCMSIVKPRSRCPKCLTWIAWYDNLPVVSWTLLGGKCRHCKNPISVRYTLVELLTGLLFLYAGWRAVYGAGNPGWPQAVQFAFESWFLGAMIVSTFIDLEFRILPDEITLSGVLIGVGGAAAFPVLSGHFQPLMHRSVLLGEPEKAFLLDSNHAIGLLIRNPHLASLAGALAGAAAGAGAIYLVGVLGKLVFHKEAMGFGDVKYMAMIGSVLGWRGVLLTFVLACLMGSILGIGKYLVVRRMGYVPFGPFLSGGALTMLFWSPAVDRGIQGYMSFVQQLTDRLLR